jgi:hypothetical protein
MFMLYNLCKVNVSDRHARLSIDVTGNSVKNIVRRFVEDSAEVNNILACQTVVFVSFTHDESRAVQKTSFKPISWINDIISAHL